jgi:DHA1 family tetracycline resistance protein-like MFS transporter
VTASETQPRRPYLAIILITLGIDALGYGIVLPVVPEMVAEFTHGDAAATARYYGLFAATYAAMQLLFAPILGGLSDRFGRRAVILPSLLCAGLDYLLMAVSPGLGLLFVGRLLSGLTGASAIAGSAYLSDRMPPERRAQAYALAAAAFGAGLVVGPALGGLLAQGDLRLPFIVAAVLNLLNFGLALVLLPESLPHEHRRPFSLARSNPLTSLLQLGRSPTCLLLAAMLSFGALSQQMVIGIWAVYTQVRFGWDTLAVGGSLALLATLGAVVQVAVLPRAILRFGERATMLSGIVVSIPGLVALGLAPSGPVLVALIVPFVYASVSGPIIRSFLSREFNASEQGLVHGAALSLSSLSAILGPALSTQLFATLGTAGAAPYVPGAPFFISAVFAAIALLLTLRWSTTQAAPADAPPR